MMPNGINSYKSRNTKSNYSTKLLMTFLEQFMYSTSEKVSVKLIK